MEQKNSLFYFYNIRLELKDNNTVEMEINKFSTENIKNEFLVTRFFSAKITSPVNNLKGGFLKMKD